MKMIIRKFVLVPALGSSQLYYEVHIFSLNVSTMQQHQFQAMLLLTLDDDEDDNAVRYGIFEHKTRNLLFNQSVSFCLGPVK